MSERRKNGMGSITYLPDGKVRMRKMLGWRENGTPRIISVTGTSETDAYRKMKAKERDLEKNFGECVYDDYYKVSLMELCKLHLNEHLKQKNRIKPKSADRRESTIRNQISKYNISYLQASSVRSQDISHHMEVLLSEGLSVSSVEKTFDVINAAYVWAISQGKLRYNPCTSIKETTKHRFRQLKTRDSADGVVIILSQNQIEKIEKYIKDNYDGMYTYQKQFALSVIILLHTGIRCGELCSLRWSDYDSEAGTLCINKTRNIVKVREGEDSKGYRPNEGPVKNYHNRVLSLDDKTRVVLDEMRKISNKNSNDDYILLNKWNRPSNPSNYDHNIRELYKKIGLPDDISGAHILRRTLATKMHNEGCRIEDIAAYLGDTQETVLKHYISLTKRIVVEGKTMNVVPLPGNVQRD